MFLWLCFCFIICPHKRDSVISIIYYLFCNDNFLNAFEIVNPLNVVDVDILSKCCVC